MNASDFQNQVNSELARRKQGIANLKLAVDSSTSGRSELRSAGFAFFYAQWEGQVKWLCGKSLEYIIAQQKSCKELVVTFQAMAIHQKLKLSNPENEKTKRSHVFRAVCESHSDILDKTFEYNARKDWHEIDGNLQTKQLKEIFVLFSINEQLHQFAHTWLATFVQRRNDVAHGDLIDIDEDIFQEAHDRVVYLIDWVASIFVNYIEHENFILKKT